MNPIWASLLALAAWFVPFALLLGSVFGARRYFHRRDRRNPLTRSLLRGPGHSLRMQREDGMLDVLAYAMVGSAMPVAVLAMYLMHERFAGRTPSMLLAAFAVGIVAFSAYKIIRQMGRLRDINLGLEAETAVGQELNWLMKNGLSVYHDVPGEGPFNVDHVVVGPSGVFAVETKGRSKPVGKDGHVVTQDGETLRFPTWTETESIAQAKRNAVWLSKWLTSAVGQRVEVTPVVCLPGWMIERSSKPAIAVINGKNSGGFFTKSRGTPLTEQLVAQINHQLDARCRDVEPTTYKPLKN